jgi:hypothetical protein
MIRHQRLWLMDYFTWTTIPKATIALVVGNSLRKW